MAWLTVMFPNFLSSECKVSGVRYPFGHSSVSNLDFSAGISASIVHRSFFVLIWTFKCCETLRCFAFLQWSWRWSVWWLCRRTARRVRLSVKKSICMFRRPSSILSTTPWLLHTETCWTMLNMLSKIIWNEEKVREISAPVRAVCLKCICVQIQLSGLICTRVGKKSSVPGQTLHVEWQLLAEHQSELLKCRNKPFCRFSPFKGHLWPLQHWKAFLVAHKGCCVACSRVKACWFSFIQMICVGSRIHTKA